MASDDANKMASDDGNKMVSDEASKMATDDTSKMVSDDGSKMVSDDGNKVTSDNGNQMVSDDTDKVANGALSKIAGDDTNDMASDDANKMATDDPKSQVMPVPHLPPLTHPSETWKDFEGFSTTDWIKNQQDVATWWSKTQRLRHLPPWPAWIFGPRRAIALMSNLTPTGLTEMLVQFEALGSTPKTAAHNGRRLTTILRLSHEFLDITGGQNTFTS